MVFGQDVLGTEGRGILSKSVKKFVKVLHFFAKAVVLLRKVFKSRIYICKNSHCFCNFCKKSVEYRIQNSGARMYILTQESQKMQAAQERKRGEF